MDLENKFKNRLIKLVPNWVIYSVSVITLLLSCLSDIKGTIDFIQDFNMDWLNTLIDISKFIVTWGFPLLALYLFSVVASLKKSVISFTERIDSKDQYFEEKANKLESDITNKINKLTEVQNTLIFIHRNHEVYNSFQKALMLIFSHPVERETNEESKNENLMKAFTLICDAIKTSSSIPLHLSDLRSFLDLLNVILTHLSKPYLEEAEKVYNWDLERLLNNLEELDIYRALSDEINTIRTTIFKMRA